MSRYYQMNVRISKYDASKKDAITAAADEEWDWEGWDQYHNHRTRVRNLYASGSDDLCGGETEEEFTRRLSLTVWKANGGFCIVEVHAISLEALPSNAHELTEEDYKKLTSTP